MEYAHTMTVLIGLDPGARDTGIVAVYPDGTIDGRTVHNDGPLLPLSRPYMLAVGDVIEELCQNAGGDYTLRVETVVRPNWHVAKAAGGGSASNPEALLGTAQLLGAIIGWYECEIVRPGKHGSKPMGYYPEQLVSDGERRREGWEGRVGTGKLRHQRSAYDIALTEPKERKSTAPAPQGRFSAAYDVQMGLSHE